MQARNKRFLLHAIEDLRDRGIVLLCVCEPLFNFVLACGQMAVHEHEACVIEVESDGSRALVCGHSFRTSLVFY